MSLWTNVTHAKKKMEPPISTLVRIKRMFKGTTVTIVIAVKIANVSAQWLFKGHLKA